MARVKTVRRADRRLCGVARTSSEPMYLFNLLMVDVLYD